MRWSALTKEESLIFGSPSELPEGDFFKTFDQALAAISSTPSIQ